VKDAGAHEVERGGTLPTLYLAESLGLGDEGCN